MGFNTNTPADIKRKPPEATVATDDEITVYDTSAGKEVRMTQANFTAGVGVTDHGALTGIGDDDHTQYLLADGSRELTTHWDVGGSNKTIYNTQFGFLAPTVATINGSGQVGAPRHLTALAAFSGTADDVDNITHASTAPTFVWLRADTGDTITLKHGTGNLVCDTAADIVLTGAKTVPAIYDLTAETWHIWDIGDVASHASSHTDGTDDIQDATNSQKGLATAAQITALEAATSKLSGIESGATADQTGAEIKTAYEGEADTNAFTDDDHSKLDGIESGATADQSDAEIETAYNNQVDVVTQAEAEAGTDTNVHRWTPQRVKQAIDALAFIPGYARVYNDAALTISTSTVTALTFNSETVDSDGFHSTSSNTDRLTVQTTGWHFIGGNVRHEGHATGIRACGVRLNGSTIIAQQLLGAAGTSAIPINVGTWWYATAGDYFQIIVYQDTGGDNDILQATNYSPTGWISGPHAA